MSGINAATEKSWKSLFGHSLKNIALVLTDRANVAASKHRNTTQALIPEAMKNTNYMD